MFFEMHDEKKIGYKHLSPADLGTSETSHQTHIGLASSVLTFLSNRNAISEDSIFIYKDIFDSIDAYFDRIENPNGTYRSPKIRIGDRGCVSVVSTIRAIVQNMDLSLEWYLVWFGLKNSKIVFLLFDNKSDEFDFFTKNGINLDIQGTKSIKSKDVNFDILMKYIEEKINKNGEEFAKELEIIAQTNIAPTNKKYRPYDIDKANENNKIIGRNGEELVNHYLNSQLEKGDILSYSWYNGEIESGLPYDFTVQDNRNEVIYIDVKTTGYNFEQDMIFSTQEIEFITNVSNPYWIFRVYKDSEDNHLLRVCDDCKKISLEINKQTKQYTDNLSKLGVKLSGAKVAVKPSLAVFKLKENIKI